MILKEGDKVKHKLSGDEMVIIRVSEEVAICKGPKWISEKFSGMEGERYICALENLIPLNSKKQLDLF